jgi:hypothetical protein
LALPEAVSTAVGSRKSVGKLATAEKPEICSKDMHLMLDVREARKRMEDNISRVCGAIGENLFGLVKNSWRRQ